MLESRTLSQTETRSSFGALKRRVKGTINGTIRVQLATTTERAIQSHTSLFIKWPGRGSPTTVKWIFTPSKDGATLVSIINARFSSDGVRS